MIERTLYNIAFSKIWGRQMRFITGPRQSGKTTLSKLKLKNEKNNQLYYLWDLRSVKNRYKKNELFFTEDVNDFKKKKWVCFDEIHKMPKWKNILKGIFDEMSEQFYFIITGSAKLNISKMAGDSLAGRYFTFHLFPLILSELKNPKKAAANSFENPYDFVLNQINSTPAKKDYLSSLLEYSGFPEPFIKQSKTFQKKWSQTCLDRIINEDIGSMTKIIDREYLYDIYNLLPQMAGSPLSFQSISSNIELTVPTVKNYLKRLEDFYLTFKISPYYKKIKRSLKKMPKFYLYDWTVIQDPAKRFENFVACELYILLHLWTDASVDKYSLHYLRNKQKQETDFLILKNNKPYLLLEAKYSDCKVESHHINMAEFLGKIPMVQVCRQENILIQQKKNIFRVSASRFF